MSAGGGAGQGRLGQGGPRQRVDTVERKRQSRSPLFDVPPTGATEGQALVRTPWGGGGGWGVVAPVVRRRSRLAVLQEVTTTVWQSMAKRVSFSGRNQSKYIKIHLKNPKNDKQ